MRTRSMRHTFWVGLFLATVLLVVKPTPQVWAAACSSNGTGGGNWSDASTWVNCAASVPQNGDDVTVVAGDVVILDTDTNDLNGLTVNGTLTTSGLARTVTVDGDVTIGDNGLIEPAPDDNTHNLLIGGNLANDGTLNGINGPGEIDVTFDNKTGDQNVSGTGSTNFHAVYLDKGSQTKRVIATTDVTMGGNTADFNPGAGLGAGTWEQNAGTLTKKTGSVGVDIDGGLVVSGSGNFVLANASLSQVTGRLIVNTTGSVNIGNGNDQLHIRSGANVQLTAGTINIFGRLRLVGGRTFIDGAIINLDPQRSDAGGVNLQETVNVLYIDGNADFTMSSGTIMLVDPNASGSTVEVQIPNTGGGAYNVSGGTLVIGDGASSSASDGSGFQIAAGKPIYNLVIRDRGGEDSRFVRLFRPLKLNGSLTIDSGGELRQGNQFIEIAGDWTNDGSFRHNSEEVYFNGVSPQIIAGDSTTAFFSWTVNSGATVVVPVTNTPTAEVPVNNNGTMVQKRAVNNANIPFLEIENRAGNSVTYRGAEIDTTTTGNNLGKVSVSIRALNPGDLCTDDPASSPYALRCFTMDPTINGPAQLRLWALTSELNGIVESDLAVFRNNNGPDWIELTIERTTGNDGNGYSYAMGYTPGFSSFLLGETGTAPTAVTLLTQSAHSAPVISQSLITALLALTITSVLGAVLVNWRLNWFSVRVR